MEHYVLSQKEESGCPAGFLQADLYDKFYSDIKGVEYGFFPWYAEKIHYKTHTPYPEGMVLISKDKFYDFDMRSVARFYIVSNDFMSFCKILNVGITGAVAIQVLSKKKARLFHLKAIMLFFLKSWMHARKLIRLQLS